MVPPNLLPYRPKRGNCRNNHDDSVSAQHLAEKSDSSNVYVSILLAVAQVGRQSSTNDVSIQHFDSNTRVQQLLGYALCKRTLAGSGKAGEPKCHSRFMHSLPIAAGFVSV